MSVSRVSVSRVSVSRVSVSRVSISRVSLGMGRNCTPALLGIAAVVGGTVSLDICDWAGDPDLPFSCGSLDRFLDCGVSGALG